MIRAICFTRSQLGPPKASSLPLSLFSMLAVGAIAGLVYARALGFAFFNDDPTGNFAWMENRSWVQLFTTSAGYGFYRPLSFLIWKLLLLIFGAYDAPVFHALPLLLHALNAALLWLLAFGISSQRPFAWLTALAFATFPFSYEAIGYVGAMFHPLLTFWALLTILLYRQFQRSSDSRHLIGAHFTLLLGLFTHENGIVIPLILLGWELLSHPSRSLSEWLSLPLYRFFAAPILFIVLWLSIPKSGDIGLQSPPSIFSNVLPFLQALIYPVLPALRLSAENVAGFATLALAVLSITYLLARVARAEHLWTFAVAWFILTAFPSILFLDPSYVYGSPRLYYFAAVGIAFLWGTPLLLWGPGRLVGAARRYLTLGLLGSIVLAILLPPLSFINCELDFFSQASHIVRSMRDHALTAPPNRDLLYINLPFFFSSYGKHPTGCPNPYPLAPMGAVVIPPYSEVRDFVRINGGPDRWAHGFTFSAYAPGWATYGDNLTPGALRATLRDGQVYVFDLISGSLFDLTGAWRPDRPPPPRSLATFAHLIALDDATIYRTRDRMEVTLRWRALDAPQRALTAFVHLYNESGILVAQHDGPPARGYAPTSLWQPGDVIFDTHTIALSMPLSAGTYVLAVGLYDSFTIARLPAYSVQGVAFPDSVYVLEHLTWP